MIAPDNRIVRRTSIERDRQSARKRGRIQSLREYIADTAIAGLREAPVTDWSSLHQRFAKEGLFLSADNGELKVKDGWDSERPGVTLSAFGHAFDTEKLIRKLGEFTPPAQDIFSQVRAVGRYEPEKITVPSRPERMTEKDTLTDYATARLRAPLIALIRTRRNELYSRYIHSSQSRVCILKNNMIDWLSVMDMIQRAHQSGQNGYGLR